jgi:phosphoglucosamine mutase
VPGAVGTLMTNMAVELALKARDVEFVRAKVGDRYVLEELEKRGWLLGGEGSGHLLALDKHTTGDGLISALQVLQGRGAQRQVARAAAAGVQLFPQTLINVRLRPGRTGRRTRSWRRVRALQPGTRWLRARADPRQRHGTGAARDGGGARRAGARAAPSAWPRPSGRAERRLLLRRDARTRGIAAT